MGKFDKARLVIAGLTGTVYISEINKKGDAMTDVRREVPKGEFIAAFIDWHKTQQELNGLSSVDPVTIIHAGKPKYKITVEEITE